MPLHPSRQKGVFLDQLCVSSNIGFLSKRIDRIKGVVGLKDKDTTMEESMEHSESGGRVTISQQDQETGCHEAVWPRNPRLSPIGSGRGLGLSPHREMEVMASMGLNPDSPSFSPPSKAATSE